MDEISIEARTEAKLLGSVLHEIYTNKAPAMLYGHEEHTNETYAQ